MSKLREVAYASFIVIWLSIMFLIMLAIFSTFFESVVVSWLVPKVVTQQHIEILGRITKLEQGNFVQMEQENATNS